MSQVCPNNYFIATTLFLNPSLAYAARPKNLLEALINDLVLNSFGIANYYVNVIMCNMLTC